MISDDLYKQLLARFKRSIGDMDNGNKPEDEYYKPFIEMAYADLASDDISKVQLESELGQSLIVLYAEQRMNGVDIASDKTIELLRNKLSLMTKGEAYEKDYDYYYVNSNDLGDGTQELVVEKVYKVYDDN